MKGSRLSAYRIDTELGMGGMGTVWLARVEEPVAGLSPGARVALKVVHRHLLGRTGFAQRFAREAEIGRMVRHPNVVATLDAHATGGDAAAELFLVMEYVEGRTLRALLEKLRVVPEALVREIARQVADGLTAIHAAGIIHRDLKPENVLITADHKVRIMDLGVARLVEESIALTKTGEFVGSLLYAAPEHLRAGVASHASDLYSLGVLVYELATGENPFARHDAAQVIAAHLHEVPPPANERNPDVSPFLSEVLRHLLAKTPGDRGFTAASLREALEAGEASRWWAERETLALARTSDLPSIPVHRTTAVYGRDDELASLRASWARACDGHGGTVFVEGEAGIGKTRLVDAFVAELRGGGARVLYGAFVPSGGGDALSDAIAGGFGSARLAEALAGYVTETPALVPAFAAFVKRQPVPPGAEALAPQAVHAVTCHLLRGLAREKPLLWVVDDLHFAEPSSRQVVLSMARALENERVLLLVTARPGLPGDDVAHLARLATFRRLELRRLSPREVMRLLRDALKSRTVAERLGGHVAYKSDGVPYFILEMIEEMKESDVLRRLSDGSWETTREVRRVEVPSAVRDLVHARLAELSEEERAILDAAAVQGFEFDADLIARVREMKRVVVLERLASLERRTGLVRGRGGRCRFDNHQVQDVLYGEMLQDLREEYHALVADAVLARDATPDSTPAGETAYRLAYHHLRGNRRESCRALLTPALDHLVGLWRHAAAADMAERALAAAGLVAGEARENVLLRKADALDFLGRRAEQRAALEEAQRIADDDAVPARRARARRRLGWHCYQVADLEGARVRLEEAVALAASGADRREEAVAVGNLASVHLGLGRLDEAKTRYERQIELARAAAFSRDEGDATANLGIVLKRLGRYDDARVCYERGIAISRDVSDRRGEAFTRVNLGALSADLGRHEEARAQYEQALTAFREIGDRPSEAAVTGNLGNLQKSMGRYADALESYETHLTLARETGNRHGEAAALANLGPLCAVMGDADRAHELLTTCLVIAAETRARRVESYARFELGVVAEFRGEAETALAMHESALAIRREIRYPKGVAASLSALGRVHLAAGRADDARAVLTEALETARSLDAADLVAVCVARLALLDSSRVAEIASFFASHAARLGHLAAVESRHLAWTATRDASHLREARRILRALVDGAPRESRGAMTANVPLHRAVLAAAI